MDQKDEIASLILKELYIKYKRHWKSIRDAIHNKEYASYTAADEERLRNVVQDYENENNVDLVSMYDDDYPEEFKKIERTIFVFEINSQHNRTKYFCRKYLVPTDGGTTEDGNQVLKWEHRFAPLTSPGKILGYLATGLVQGMPPLIGVEHPTKFFTYFGGITTMYVEPDNENGGCWLVMHDGESEPHDEESVVIANLLDHEFRLKFVDEIEAYKRMIQLCRVILYTKGDTKLFDMIDLAQKKADQQIFAVPGPGGSNTNVLIKKHAAQLCDSVEDLGPHDGAAITEEEYNKELEI